MTILNYTTKVPVERSVQEIQKTLVKAGATATMLQYDSGMVSSIAFKLDTKHGPVSFLLPSNPDGVLRVMRKGKAGKVTPEQFQQANRVSWRILKDWIEAQMAIISAEMATPLQVFLPYAQTKDGTVYECFERGGMSALTDQSGR
jgi:hypothetical protein